MTAVIIPETNGLSTHDNDLSAPVGSTSVADNVSFGRDGRPERRRGFKDYSAGLPDFAPKQILTSANGAQAFLHLDDGIWYHDGSEWIRKSGSQPYTIGSPGGVWFDSSNNDLYVCDGSRHCVWKLDLDRGLMTPFAGLAGTSGTADGTATTARFNGPCGIWGDGAGNLYVVDRLNFSVRKITSSQVVTTFAGQNGSSAYTDSTGTSARFQTPFAIWGDGTNLYVTEDTNGRVRKIVVSSAVVSTLASGLTTPRGCWIANAGSLLYCTTSGQSTLTSVNASSGATATITSGLVGGGLAYSWIAGDDAGRLYVSQSTGFQLVTISGGAVSSLSASAGLAGIAFTQERIIAAQYGAAASGVVFYYTDHDYDYVLFPASSTAGGIGYGTANGIVVGPD